MANLMHVSKEGQGKTPECSTAAPRRSGFLFRYKCLSEFELRAFMSQEVPIHRIPNVLSMPSAPLPIRPRQLRMREN